MAEVLGILSAVQATTQLIEQAFGIIGRLRRAYKRQKDLVEVLNSHESELNSITIIIEIIKDEEELRTHSVATELKRLKDVQSKLSKFLEKLDPKPRGKIGQFAHELAHGSADEKKLCDIMKELVQIKTALLLRIQVADVGVIRTMEKQLVANTETIQRIDSLLRKELEDYKGLRIARILKGRRPSNDGTVPLTPDDLRMLSTGESDDDSADETLVDESELRYRSNLVKTERIVCNNIARQDSLQINAALGEDTTKHIDRLVIKDNVSDDRSMQVNHATAIEILQIASDIQMKRLLMKHKLRHGKG